MKSRIEKILGSNSVTKNEISIILAVLARTGIKTNDIEYLSDTIKKYYKETEEELNNQLSKEIHVLLQNSTIELLPQSQRKVEHLSKEQRRMDSLCRLLTPSVQSSPCIAVATYDNKIIIGSNEPDSSDVLKENIYKKLACIQQFLAYEVITDKDLHNIVDLLISSGGLYINGAEEKIKKDIKKFHAYVKSNPNFNSYFSKQNEPVILIPGERIDTLKRLRETIAEKEKKINSFKQNRNNKEISITFEDKNKNSKNQKDIENLHKKFKESSSLYHAEQLVIHFISQQMKNEKNNIHVGIVKLCCQGCYQAINHYNDSDHYLFKIRGTHGLTFPVIDILNNGAFTKTDMYNPNNGSQLHEDSDSDVEIFDINQEDKLDKLSENERKRIELSYQEKKTKKYIQIYDHQKFLVDSKNPSNKKIYDGFSLKIKEKIIYLYFITRDVNNKYHLILQKINNEQKQFIVTLINKVGGVPKNGVLHVPEEEWSSKFVPVISQVTETNQKNIKILDYNLLSKEKNDTNKNSYAYSKTEQKLYLITECGFEPIEMGGTLHSQIVGFTSKGFNRNLPSQIIKNIIIQIKLNAEKPKEAAEKNR